MGLSEDSIASIRQMEQDCAATMFSSATPVEQTPLTITEDDESRFLAGVSRILDYLDAGDVFQVNLSRRWTARYGEPVDATALYERLRQANPAPFAGLASWRGSTVLSSSPERLIELSGGMAQRVVIAMALIAQPKVLLADDATLGLDATIQLQVLDLLVQKGRELGLAVVLITHDLGMVAAYCDRVGIMKSGELLELE
eukprot:gene13083-16685_t